MTVMNAFLLGTSTSVYRSGPSLLQSASTETSMLQLMLQQRSNVHRPDPRFVRTGLAGSKKPRGLEGNFAHQFVFLWQKDCLTTARGICRDHERWTIHI